MLLNKKNKNKKGFTLVELIVVIAIIAILAAVTIPLSLNYIKKANEAKAIAELGTYKSQLTAGLLEKGTQGAFDASGATLTGFEYEFKNLKGYWIEFKARDIQDSSYTLDITLLNKATAGTNYENAVKGGKITDIKVDNINTLSDSDKTALTAGVIKAIQK